MPKKFEFEPTTAETSAEHTVPRLSHHPVYAFQLHHYIFFERSILLAVEHFRLVSRLQERTVASTARTA